jgi:3-methyladenine DNA glycosylase AlkD
MQHHKYSLTEIEEMIPWEREVYIAMLVDYIKQENERLKLLKQTAKHM